MNKNSDPGHSIELPPLRLDLKAGRLWKGERPIELRPKPWELMLFMAHRPGELLSKQELMDAVWPDSFVTESSLNQAVKELRKALGDNARTPRFIETVHRRGFRLLTRDDPASPVGSLAQVTLPEPIFGRSEEFELLTTSLKTACAGHAQIVFITGEAGIGKTTLVRQFLNSRPVQTGNLALGWGHCYDLHGESEAYLPILEGIDRLARGQHGDRVQHLLGRYAPSWHEQFPWMLSGGNGTHHLLKALTPTRMLRELCDFIEVLAASAPVLMWLEDLHWSDTGTVDLLETLAQRLADSRLLLIASYRPVDAAVKGARVAVLKRSLEVRGLASELPLEYLEPSAISQILAHKLDSNELPASLSDLLYEQTSGNPLFVSTALNHLLASDLLACKEGRWILNASVEEIQSSCPESLKHIVDLQRSTVSQEEAATLDAASVAGIIFDTQAVAGALGTEPLIVETVLDGLADSEQFLRRAGTSNWPDGSICSRYEFVHDVFRESIYQSLAPGQRQNYHRQIAACMDAGFVDAKESVAAELALHSELGGDRQRAIRFLILAAHRAQTLQAPREALAHLERALGQLAKTPQEMARDRIELRILLQLIPSLIGAEGFTSKRLPGRIDQALALCERLDDSINRLKVLITQSSVMAVPGTWNVLERCNRELLEASETISDPKLLVHQVNQSGYVYIARGEATNARRQLQAGITMLKKEDVREPARLFGHDPTISAMSYLAFAEWLLGHADQAKSITLSARHRAETIGIAQSMATAFHVSSTIALFRGEIDEARHFQNMLQQCLDRNEIEYLYMRPLATYTCLLIQEGRPDEAVRVARDGIVLARENQAVAYSSVSLTALAEAHLEAGSIEDGLASIEEAQAHAERVGEQVWRPESLRIRGKLLSAAGAKQAAEESFRMAVRYAEEQLLLSLELRTSLDLAQILYDQGGAKEADPLLAGVLKRFNEGYSTADYQDAQSLLSSCRLPAAQ